MNFGDKPIDTSRLTGECTCVAAWAKRPNVRVRLMEHHPDCASLNKAQDHQQPDQEAASHSAAAEARRDRQA